jgi:hypothetical protein
MTYPLYRIPLMTRRWDAHVTNMEKIHRVVFEFDSPLPKGEAKLWIRFRGSLMHNMCGFYRSSYKDEMGREK